MTRVEELIAFLQTQDPKAPVYVTDDGSLCDLTWMAKIDPEEARIGRYHKNSVVVG